jgi:SAM-dependent methyltransferase
MTPRVSGLRRKARQVLRRNQLIYDVMRTVRYGPLYGIRDQRVRKALVRRARSEGWRTLNLGSGGRRMPDAINLDVTQVTGPDVVGDGNQLPFCDGMFDAIICDYVIEHVADPEGFLGEARRTLKPAGFFYLEVPFLQPLHGGGMDFTRWTRKGFVAAAERADLEVRDMGVHLGPAFTLHWILKEWIATLLSCALSPVYQVVRYVMGWVLAPLLLLDALMLHLPWAENLANGFYVVATHRTNAAAGPTAPDRKR